MGVAVLQCNSDTNHSMSEGCSPQQDSPCFRCHCKFRCPQDNHTSDQLATNLGRESHNPFRFDSFLERLIELRKVLYLRLLFYHTGHKAGPVM